MKDDETSLDRPPFVGERPTRKLSGTPQPETSTLFPADTARDPRGAHGGEPADPPRDGSRDEELPAHIGPYGVSHRIARGGMGDVLAVRDFRFDRLLALKRLDPFPTSELQRELFVAEMQVTASLDHPHIVPVLDRGTEVDGRPYFVMPVLRGQTLRDVIRADGEDRRPLTECLGLFMKAAEAISFAHQRGVLHLDIKPANVWVGESDAIYVLDWGLAQLAGAKRAAFQIGTPGYMAPEQQDPDVGPLGPATDVYGLGGVLYSIATRHPPPRRALRGDLDRPTAVEAPRGLQEILARALAFAPADRYPDVGSLMADVRAYLSAAHTVRVLHRRIRPGQEAQYEAWASEITDAVSRFAGHHSTTNVRLPRQGDGPGAAYLIISRFESAEHHQRFDRSEIHDRFVERLQQEDFTESTFRLDTTGEAAWVELDPSST